MLRIVFPKLTNYSNDKTGSLVGRGGFYICNNYKRGHKEVIPAQE